MRRLSLLVLLVLAVSSVAMAQTKPTYKGGADVLGAHNGYGRGCVMCHAPHSGSLGNGKVSSTDPQNGMYALWGQDLTPLYGKTFNFSGDNKATYAVTLPSAPVSAHDANTVILFCLSCHDGVLTNVGMMEGQTVETLPIVGGTAPTLLAKAAPAGGTAYQNDHPVGQNAIVSCGGSYNWDCTGGGNTATPITMNGAASSVFLTNYPGSFWNGSNPLATFGTTVNAVTCTTCHDQHSMTVYSNKNGSFTTMFFVRGQYNPNSNGNSVAQFCRNCHGGESNEAHGVMNVPTI
ncbi:MAG: hypothetical protein P4N24_17100 [Acidobacteriota bacterium]|nr:hypothetical protein [Acidobacteriota bacterium]